MKVSLYKRKTGWEQNDIDFDSNVVILSVNTAKGLGFDAVFFVYLKGKEMHDAGELDLLMRKYYVASTRTKLFLGVVCSCRKYQISKFFEGTEYDIISF